MEDEASWANLPEELLAEVFSYLCVEDRYRAGTVCKHWWQCLSIPLIWRHFKCGFFLPGDQKLLKCVKHYGLYFLKLTIILNQKEKHNRDNALGVIQHLSDQEEMRLTHLTIQFKGENPLFYSGYEFLTALTQFFSKLQHNKSKNNPHPLKYLNFRGMNSDFDGDFIRHLADGCPNLEYLNIINKNLICNVPSESVQYLVGKCTKLKVLHLFHSSLSNNVLTALSEPGREKLQRLGLVCRRFEKYGEDISSETWAALMEANPDLKVELGFDHTCPLHKVTEILKPEIPVQELYFETYTRITHEVNLAATYYAKTLEKFSVHTKPNKGFEDALLDLVRQCKKLRILLVYGVLDRSVVDEILSLLPEMAERGTYILKWEMEPEPWVVGQEDGD